MDMIDKSVLNMGLDWQSSDDVEYPYHTIVDGKTWKVKVNSDFPLCDLYTLVVGDKTLNFNDWPEAWDLDEPL